MLNAMSVDLEDWFCAYNMSGVVPPEAWEKSELRVVDNTRRLLSLFDRKGVTATFFVLGWIAGKVPDLIREIDARGHEIAAHGFGHLLITRVAREEFVKDLEKSLDAIEKCGIRQRVVGYRAPSFTIVERTRWALDDLAARGLKYDSSVFPVGFHPDYGLPNSPLAPYSITPQMQEFPLSCVRVLGRTFPCSGGGYFRLMPYAYTKACMRRVNREGRPVIFYIHPWEIDPGQPRMPIPWLKRVRHYYGLAANERKLEQLLSDFAFTSIRRVLGL